MHMLIVFFIYSLAFWAAGSALLKLFFIAIERGQVLDQLFGWRAMLDRLYGSEKRWKNNLGKALGDCAHCTSFWFNFAWFFIYYIFARLVLHYFITDVVQSLPLKVFVFVVWLFVFNGIGATLGIFIAYFKTRKNGL